MSRYPKPGSTTSCYSDARGLRWGTAVVLATSRHKTTYAVADAVQDLTDMYTADGATVEFERTRWSSVRESDREFIDEEAGAWHSEGSGSAWVDALCGYPTYPDDVAGAIR